MGKRSNQTQISAIGQLANLSPVSCYLLFEFLSLQGEGEYFMDIVLYNKQVLIYLNEGVTCEAKGSDSLLRGEYLRRPTSFSIMQDGLITPGHERQVVRRLMDAKQIFLGMYEQGMLLWCELL